MKPHEGTARILPESTRAISIETIVVARNGQVFELRLWRRHAIEGIAVHTRQQPCPQRVADSDGERRKILIRQVVEEAVEQRVG